MPLPIRSLPVWQSWDCQGCGNCCRDYQVAVSDEERARIAGQGWEKEAALGGRPLFVRQGPWWRRRWRLNHAADGTCVFLNEQGRCRIHEKFGGEAKPLACRIYPFMLIPAGDQWRVGLRFACPSAAGNRGRPLREHKLDGYAAELAAQTGIDPARVPPPPLQHGQRVDWGDLVRMAQALVDLLRDGKKSFEHRLRLCLALARMCRQARFDKITGGRLAEFLETVSLGIESEVPAEAAQVPTPSWIGRVLFRQFLALYTRKDQGTDVGEMRRGPWQRLRAALRFAVGRGAVPRVHGWIPETTFERVEEPGGALPEAAQAVLERYFAFKVSSLQFCGATNFGLAFWPGFESLALTCPIMLWLARAMRELPREEAVTRAVIVVDHNFGFNRLLGNRRQRHSLDILAQRGELEKLIAWYSR